MMDSWISVCKECGKKFVPAPNHVYKTRTKIFCSWHCLNEDYKRREAKKQERKKQIAALAEERRRLGIKLRTQNRPDREKPVLQYTKEGKFIARYSSGKEAFEKTGVSPSIISRCCCGYQQTAKKYIWRFETEGI